jgi:hypothetical protein
MMTGPPNHRTNAMVLIIIGVIIAATCLLYFSVLLGGIRVGMASSIDAWIQACGTIVAGGLAVFGGYLAFRGAIRQSEAAIVAAQLAVNAAQVTANQQRLMRAKALAGLHAQKLVDFDNELSVVTSLAICLRRPIIAELAPPSRWNCALPPFLTLPLDDVLALGIPIIRQREPTLVRLRDLAETYERAWGKYQDIGDRPDDASYETVTAGVARTIFAEVLEEDISEAKVELQRLTKMLWKVLYEIDDPEQLERYEF